MTGNEVSGFITLAVIAIFYFMPWFISVSRKHNNSGAIFLTNLIFGWTVLGWVIALIWANTGNVPKPEKR